MNNSDFEKVKECFFWYINRKKYTKKELVDRVIKKEYEPDLVYNVADYLEEAGYIDDKDYATRFIKDSYNLKKHGETRIKQELSAKGVSRNTVDDVLAELDLDFKSLLVNVAEDKAGKLDLTDIKQKNSLIGFLLRRGFKSGEIFEVIRNMEKGE